MLFIKNGTEYPRHVGDIESENPDWELGQALPEGWALVQETALPTKTTSQRVEELSPELVDGVWSQRWQVVDLTEAELSAEPTSLYPKTTVYEIVEGQVE